MTDPVVLWLRGRSPPWPGLAEGLGPGVVVDGDTDVSSMRDVRSRAVELGPDAIVYAGVRGPSDGDPDTLFRQIAEATIGVAAAAMELSAAAVLVSHPSVFGGPGGPWSEADPAEPDDALGEAFRKAEIFLGRAAAQGALVVRAGPVLGTGLEAERSRLEAGAARPRRGRRMSPVGDRELGRVLRELIAAGARGTVHVGGLAIEELELWRRIAEVVSAPAPRPVDGPGRTSWVLAADRLRSFGVRPIEDPCAGLRGAPGPGGVEASGLVSEATGALGPPSSGGVAAAPRRRAPPEVAAAANAEVSAEPEEGAHLAPGEGDRLWIEGPPRGVTALGPGLAVVALAAGEGLGLAEGALVVLRAGKLLLEEGETDRVLRPGARARVARGGGRAVAVSDAELWRLDAGRPG